MTEAEQIKHLKRALEQFANGWNWFYTVPDTHPFWASNTVGDPVDYARKVLNELP